MGKPACHDKPEKIYNEYEYIVHITNDRLKGLNMARLLTDSQKRETDKQMWLSIWETYHSKWNTSETCLLQD